MGLHPTLSAECIAIRKLPNSVKRVRANGDYDLFPSPLRLDLNSYNEGQHQNIAGFGYPGELVPDEKADHFPFIWACAVR